MKYTLSRLILITLILAVVVAACAPTETSEPEVDLVEEPTEISPTEAPTEQPTPEPIVVEDGRGVEVILNEPAQKIVSITPSMTEILFGVGAGANLIGRDSNSTYPEAALEAVDLGGMWDGIPIEDLLALEPDLVLAGEIYSDEAITELRELGLTVFWQANPDDFEGLYENIREIAILTGTQEQADELITNLTKRVAALDEKLADVDATPLVFYELDASEPANPWTTGAGTFISYVITKAKGVNLGDSLKGEWVQISSEALVEQNPDVILLADALYGVTIESVAGRAGWSDLTAVQENEVYPFDPFILSVPGPRLVDGFEQVAEILHPEIFD